MLRLCPALCRDSANMLCKVCIGVLQHRNNLISDEFEDDEGRKIMSAHHRTSQGLESSAAEGCHVCRSFWDQMSSSEQEALRNAELVAITERELSLLNRSPDEEPQEEDLFEWLTICILMRGMDDCYQGGFVFTVAFSGDGIIWNDVGVQGTDVALGVHVLQPILGNALPTQNHLQSPDTSSDEAWGKALSWLEICQTSHSVCNEDKATPEWYPTRLLYLDASHGEETIRLIHTAEETPSGGYTTLSHCWGKAHIIQLNQSTLSAFRLGIPISDMPKTFQEAIIVSRRLGIPYIWIDSLCIMQDKDDLSDWFREAALMHKVYMHSSCNVSASASKDSSEGLFRPRDPEILHSTQVNLCVRRLQEGAAYIQCMMIDFMFWKHSVSQCPINKRGWVVQERLLAPRVLHFGRYQLFWECREMDACEQYPTGLPKIFADQAYANFKATIPSKNEIEFKDQDSVSKREHEFLKKWSDIITAYTATLLTVPGDKLIALSGLAKRMRPAVPGNRYVAGMWRSSLENQLLWQVSNQKKVDGSPSSRPSAYRAPTWSWASVDGEISMAYDKEKEKDIMIEVKDVHIEYATDDVTGVVKSGWLELGGYLKPCTLSLETLDDFKRWRILMNGLLVRRSDESLPDEERLGPTIWLDVPMPDDSAFEADNTNGSLFYIPVSAHNDFLWMLLLRLADPVNRHFERLGVIATDDEEEKKMLLAEVDHGTNRDFPFLSCIDRKQTIRIV